MKIFEVSGTLISNTATFKTSNKWTLSYKPVYASHKPVSTCWLVMTAGRKDAASNAFQQCCAYAVHVNLGMQQHQ